MKHEKKIIKPKTKHGKSYQKVASLVEKGKTYSIEEGIKLVKQTTFSSKNATLEVHINLNLDVSKTENKIKTRVTLPFGTGRETKVLVIDASDLDKVKDIIEGKIKPQKDFDIVVAHPTAMKELAKAARILGPKGIMPNPKNGTVSEKPEEKAKEFKKGSIELKVEKAPIVHTVFGKTDFENVKLAENLREILKAIKLARPSKVKGAFITSVYISSSMSPSVKVAQ